jgi:hypothetical protein
MSVTWEIVDDAVTLTYTLTPAISATVTLTVTKPDLSTSNPSVVEAPTGTYKATFALDVAGLIWLYKFKATGAATDAEDGYFFVEPNVAPNLYATVDQLKARFGISDAVDDYLIRHAIRSASRAIDDDVGHRWGGFYPDVTATQKQYRTTGNTVDAVDGQLLFVDAISSTSGLIVEVGDGTTWTAVTDYTPEPLNAIAEGQAITALRRNRSVWSFSLLTKVRVTAKWGWPTIPAPIRDATEILAGRLFKRKDAPFGIAGIGEFGDIRISRSDPDVERDIAPYRLAGFG